MKKRVFRERYNNEQQKIEEVVGEVKKDTKKSKKKVNDDNTTNDK